MIDLMRSPGGGLMITGSEDEVLTVVAAVMAAAMAAQSPPGRHREIDLLREVGGDLSLKAMKLSAHEDRERARGHRDQEG